MEPRVKLDRFTEDQQSELLWVTLKRGKTQERDVKNHERPIKSEIRTVMRGTKRDEMKSRKTTQSGMIITSKFL